ncbi:31954_t:CDS:1 [Racocetra persica]|uniref:31954_t:CDS:1 n=1 Tax=Racocetra persica TaxID=160502 RepID=A0ACA9M038_9GLOM|nr:31954_t:CDS:1 [Racocetra persica]
MIIESSKTFIKFSIMDQKFYPLFRIRTLEKVAFSYKCNLTFAQVQSLIEIMYTYKMLIKSNLDILNSSDKEFCTVDKDNKDKSNYKKDDSSSEEIEKSCSGEEE